MPSDAPTPSSPPPPPRPLRHLPQVRSSASLTFDDLVSDLIWPTLLRTGHLALRPSRIALALVLLLGVLLIGFLFNRLDNDPNGSALTTALTQVQLDAATAGLGASRSAASIAERGGKTGEQLFDIFLGVPAHLISHHTLACIIALPLLIAWISIFFGALARSSACELSLGQHLSFVESLAFALSRWKSLILAPVLPLFIIWAIALGLAIAGWVLFSLPVLNVVGGLLWGIFILLGLVASVVIVVYALGQAMLIPSVACEGTDAVDAAQHAYSFVFARPGRVILYQLVLLAQLLLLVALVTPILFLGVRIAQWSAVAWSGQRGQLVLGNLPGVGELPAMSTPETALQGASALAHALALFWSVLPAILPVAIVVSFYCCASTVLYLCMRRLVDGQDISELWSPGLLESTLSARQSSAVAPAPASSSASVSDTGPADET